MKNWFLDKKASINVPQPVRTNPTAKLESFFSKIAEADELGRLAAQETVKTAGLTSNALSFMAKSPGAAARLGGAAVGAVGGYATGGGYNPATGQQSSRLGRALVGGAAGYGVGTMASRSIPMMRSVKTFGRDQLAKMKSAPVANAAAASHVTPTSAPSSSVAVAPSVRNDANLMSGDRGQIVSKGVVRPISSGSIVSGVSR